jgi:superfamily II DNA or RNA helicase
MGLIQPTDNVLILFKSVEKGYARVFTELLYAVGVQSLYIDGTVKIKDKIAFIDEFNNNKEIRVLIASETVEKGLNMPKINKIICFECGKAIAKLKQKWGRGTRLDGGDNLLEIHDFYIESRALSEHSTARIKAYIKEGYEPEFTYERHATNSFMPKSRNIII